MTDEVSISEIFERLDRIEAQLPEDRKNFLSLYNNAQRELETIKTPIQKLEAELGRIFQHIPDLKRLAELAYTEASDGLTNDQEIEKHWLFRGLRPAQKRFWKKVETLSLEIGMKGQFLSRWTEHINLLKLEASNRQISLPEGLPTQNSSATQPHASSNTRFDPRSYGGKELCIVVSYFKADKHGLRKLAVALKNNAGISYNRGRVKHPDPLSWFRADASGFRKRLNRLRRKARKEGWWDHIPPEYHKSYCS